jgi:hypothetical protein
MPRAALRSALIRAAAIARPYSSSTPDGKLCWSRSAAAIDVSQIGVATAPGSTSTTWMPQGDSSSRRVPQRELGDMVRASHGGHDAITDRAEVDDPASAATQQRQQRLGDCMLADHVDLQLAAQLGWGQELQRRGHGDPSIVDQSGQAAIADLTANQLGSSGHRVLVGDVQQRRQDPLAEPAP